MKKSNQHNHPKKGDNITVEPIRRIGDIKSISDAVRFAQKPPLVYHGNQQRASSRRSAQAEGKSRAKSESRRHSEHKRIKDRQRQYTCCQQGRS